MSECPLRPHSRPTARAVTSSSGGTRTEGSPSNRATRACRGPPRQACATTPAGTSKAVPTSNARRSRARTLASPRSSASNAPVSRVRPPTPPPLVIPGPVPCRPTHDRPRLQDRALDRGRPAASQDCPRAQHEQPPYREKSPSPLHARSTAQPPRCGPGPPASGSGRRHAPVALGTIPGIRTFSHGSALADDGLTLDLAPRWTWPPRSPPPAWSTGPGSSTASPRIRSWSPARCWCWPISPPPVTSAPLPWACATPSSRPTGIACESSASPTATGCWPASISSPPGSTAVGSATAPPMSTSVRPCGGPSPECRTAAAAPRRRRRSAARLDTGRVCGGAPRADARPLGAGPRQRRRADAAPDRATQHRGHRRAPLRTGPPPAGARSPRSAGRAWTPSSPRGEGPASAPAGCARSSRTRRSSEPSTGASAL